MLDIFRYGSTGIPSLILLCVYEFQTNVQWVFYIRNRMHSHFAGNVAGVTLDHLVLLPWLLLFLLLLLLPFENHDKTHAVKAMLYAIQYSRHRH